MFIVLPASPKATLGDIVDVPFVRDPNFFPILSVAQCQLSMRKHRNAILHAVPTEKITDERFYTYGVIASLVYAQHGFAFLPCRSEFPNVPIFPGICTPRNTC